MESQNIQVINILPHVTIKKQLLISAAIFYKTNKRSVSLADLGYNSNKFVRIYESLTKQNHFLFKRANEYRRNKYLHSVFTRDGRVFVKISHADQPLHINDIRSLESVTVEINNISKSTSLPPDVDNNTDVDNDFTDAVVDNEVTDAVVVDVENVADAVVVAAPDAALIQL